MNDARLTHRSPTKKVPRPAILKCRTKSGDFTPRTSKLALHQTAAESTKLDMAASFLQFCAACEKQIMTPCNSILYCSEACRRKDSSKPLSMSNTGMSPASSPPSSPRPILSLRTPSGSYQFTTPSIRIPTDIHNAKSDLDPTEWKPKLHHRLDSEAYRYLSQYHRSTTAIVELNEKRERPPFLHASTTGMTTGFSTPSLSLASTPTSPSSWSTNGGYEFNTRPLQARHNPIYSASAGMTKGIDLVTPHVPPTAEVAASVLPGGLSAWEKKVGVHGSGSGPDGLSALFGSETPR